MNNRINITIFMLIYSMMSYAQVAEYYFSQETGTYTALVSETVLWSGTFDNAVDTIDIPSFTMNGTAYTSMVVSTNGFITFGGTSPAITYYTPISGTTAYHAAISPFGLRLQNAASGSPKISYNTNDGGEIVVQWQDIKRYSAAGDVASFQIRLNPTNGFIKIVYGSVTTTYASTSYPLQVGLRGTSDDDYNNRLTTTSWAATTAGDTDAATCRFNNTVYPASGLTFTWKPLYNPTSFVAVANGFDQIDLSWVKNSLNHNVVLAYTTDNVFGTPVSEAAYPAESTIPGGGTVLYNGSGTSFSHEDINPTTTYYYKIWSYDAVPDYSSGVTSNMFISYPLPYLQDFPTTSLPERWTSNMSFTVIHGTIGSIGLNRRLSSGATTYYAITPLIGDIATNTNLSFHYRLVNYDNYPYIAKQLSSGEKIDIQVSLDDGANFTTFHTIDQSNHTTTTEFTNKVLSLAAYDGELIKIRFLCTWGSGDYYVDIDNVLFENGTDMSYTGSTTEQQNFTNVGINSLDNEIIRLKVITQKSTNPLSVTSITFSTAGSTNATNDIAAAKVYFTTTPVFSTAVQFGSTYNNPPAGAFTVTGSQALAQGNSYLWLAYDIKATATATNLVDGQCTQFFTSESGDVKIPNLTTVTGTRKIGAVLSGTKSIPTDYATIAAAVTALNNGVVGSGGVTFNVAVGHAETSANITLNATGTSSNQIIFQKSGEGANPLITAAAGTSATVDGIIKIAGGDYITFDRIDMLDPTTNTTSTTRMEWGYALVKLQSAIPVNGCQYVTIKNCTITLQKAYTSSIGIYAGNHIATSTSLIPVVATTDAMNNCKFYSNYITNVYTGIKLSGYDDATPYTFYNQGNEVGVSGGNTIINFGGLSAAAYGIYLIFDDNCQVKNNTINNLTGGGSGFANAATGIYNASTTEVAATAEYNNINLTAAATASKLYGIYSSVTGELQLNHNTIALANSVSSSSDYAFIYNLQPTTTTTSNDIYINDNIFAASNFQSTGLSYLIYNNNPRLQPSVTYIQNNTTTGTINSTAASGSFIQYNNTSGNGTGIENISGNNFSNIALAGVTAFRGIYSTPNANCTQNVYDNTISNITGGSSNAYAIYLGSANNREVYGNQIYNISCGGKMYGIYFDSGSNPGHIYKNEIFNLSSTSTSANEGVVNGILVAGGTNVYLYNNFISELKAPLSPSFDAIRGISVTSLEPNSNIGVYYNTVYLNATSSGTNFGTTGLYQVANSTATSASLDLRNNLIINNSTPNGSALIVAYRKNTSNYTDNYSIRSNNNIFYAGVPASNRLIYWGNTTKQTIEEYRDYIGPNRDSVSFSELPPFINVTTAPYNLRLQDGTANYCESGGQPITVPISITDDFDGATRPSTPDIGADEFSGTSAYVEKPQALTASSYNSQQIKLDFEGNSFDDDIVIVFNLTGIFSDPSGTPVEGQPLAGGTVLYVGTVSPFIHTGLAQGDTVYYKIFSYSTPYYSIGRKTNAVPLVLPVTNLSATAATQTQIDLAWTKNASDHDVLVAVYISTGFGTPANGTSYAVGNSIPGGGTVIYKGLASGYNHTGLTQWTQYFYRVWSFDAYNYYSVFTANNTVTDSDPVTVPYLQNFDGTWSHSPAEPSAWRVVDADGGGMSWMRSTTSPHSAPACARGYEFEVADDYLISPPLVLPDTELQISWWDITTNASLNSYKVLLSTTNKAISSFTFELEDIDCTLNTWEQHTIDLSDYKGQTVYIAFYQDYSTASGENFRIDDVFIETLIPGAATAPMPSDDLMTMINPTLKWNAPMTSFPILGYKVYHGTTPNPSNLVYDGPDKTFQMGDLDYSSIYYWKVVPYNSYCEAMNVPVWSFTTVTSTQLAESFEAGYFPPIGWSNRNGWSASTTEYYHGNQAARGLTWDDYPMWYPILITPLLEITAGDKLEFFERATSTTIINRFQIYYSNDKTADIQDWDLLGSAVQFTKAAWGHKVIDLNALAGNNYYLAIQAWSSTGTDYVYIDHVTGPDLAPVLPAPATTPYPYESADFVLVTPTLSWDPGIAGGIPTGYRLYMDTDPNPTTLVYDNSNTFYSSTTLLNDTTYYWKVVPYNIVGDATDCPVWSFKTIPELALQIGTGYSVYPSLPISVSVDYSYTQTLYLQPEIDISGSRISKIYFEFSGGGGGGATYGMTEGDADFPFKDWVIYMGHTNKSSFNSVTDWIPFEDLTLVFDGEVAFSGDHEWIEITLDIPFEYNNTGNLVIAVDENTSGAAGAESCYFYGTDTTVARALVYEDYSVNPDPETPPAAGAQVYGFANIRMQLEGIPTVPVFRVTPTSKDFGYVVLESESSPQIFTIRNNGVGTLTITSVALTGTDDDQFQLTDTNDYPADLAAYESIAVNVTFNPTTEGSKTAVLAIAHNLTGSPAQVALSGIGLDPVIDDFPFTETFEDDSPFRVLWTQIQEYGTGLWTYETGAGFYGNINTAHGGDLNARFTSSPDGNITKLVSPVIDLTSITDPYLVFWYGQQSMDPDQNELKVYYRIASDQSWVQLFWDDQDKYEWTPKVLALPNKSTTYQLAFEGIDNYGFANVLDDVTVGPPPEPELTIAPTEYDFGNKLTGTESDPLTFTIFNSGAVLLTIDTVVINGTDADYFLLDDLNVYPVDLDYGEWIEVIVSFLPGSEGAKTAALEITSNAIGSPHQATLIGMGLSATISDFPFTETFEDNSPTRDFWTQIQEYGSGLWTYANGAGGGSITDAHGGLLNARFTDVGDFDSTKLVSPIFDLTGVANPQVEFWYGQEAWDIDQNVLRIYYRIASDQPWVEIFFDNTDRIEWTSDTLALPNKSATYQLAFEGIDKYGFANVLDDVTVGPASVIITIWCGTVSDDWTDPANWSHGVPGLNYEVIITPGTFDPVIETDVTILKITVEEGANVIIYLDGSLTVTGN